MKLLVLRRCGHAALVFATLPVLNSSAIPPSSQEISVLAQSSSRKYTPGTQPSNAEFQIALTNPGEDQSDQPPTEVVPEIASETMVPSSLPAGTRGMDFQQYQAPTAGQEEVSRVTDSNAEVVRERFDNGKPRIERQVALDDKGNFVNHGRFQEWNRAGDIVMQGDYVMGVRDGMWVRIHQVNEGGIFKSTPYTQFTPPFTSQANFVNGQLQGEWTIRDAEGRVISEIQFDGGVRSGIAKWNHPSGVALFEATYTGGILNGAYIERDAKGKEVSRNLFKLGQRQEVEREYFTNKRLKSEVQYLSAPQHMQTLDDWATAKFASYDKQGDRIKHGPFTFYYESGEVKAKGAYAEGVLDGPYESWHANGQVESKGTYRQGAQHGDWSWWHNNGMRQATGSYVEGRPSGVVMQWQADGTRVDTSTVQVKSLTNGADKKQAMQRRGNFNR